MTRKLNSSSSETTQLRPVVTEKQQSDVHSPHCFHSYSAEGGGRGRSICLRNAILKVENGEEGKGDGGEGKGGGGEFLSSILAFQTDCGAL